LNRAVRAALLLALLPPLAACGAKALAVGSKPFPAARPVFVDASGNLLAALPAAQEPARLVLLDFPWCPACADAWKALRAASDQLPPDTARVYRVLFDRETAVTAAGRRETPPLHPAPIPGFGDADGAGGLAITTLTALPGAFREEYRLSQAPVLVLLAADGTVARRWIGYSPSMAGEVAGEIRKRSLPPSPLPPEK
jgi:hypothetical protein